MTRVRLDLIAGVVLLVFSVIMYVLSYRFTGYAIMEQVRDVGPAFLPRLLLVFLGLQSIFFIIQSLKKARLEAGPSESGTGQFFQLRPAVLFGLFLAYATLATVLGYVIATFFFIMSSILLLGVRKIWTIVVVPPSLTLIIYFLFERLLGVWLPKGDLF